MNSLLKFLSMCRRAVQPVAPSPPQPNHNDASATQPEADWAINIENMNFRYSDKPVYHTFSAKINLGEKIALIGSNGVGKTTLLKLLTGLYSPTDGTISYGCTNSIQPNRISMAFQDSHLFAFSLVENLACMTLAEWEQVEYNKKQKLMDLLEVFDLKSIVERNEKQLAVSCGKQLDVSGEDYSGGEKQRFAIVRAFFQPTSILFLDEPTATLDPISEKMLYEKLNQIAGNRTVIYTSHRLGSTSFCDRILFIKQSGEVLLSDFKSLYQDDLEFRSLYQTQAQPYIAVDV